MPRAPAHRERPGGRAGPAGRRAGERRGTAGAAPKGRPATGGTGATGRLDRRLRHPGRRAAAGAPRPQGLPEGHAGIDDLRRGQGDPARPRVGGRVVVRPVVEHVLDDQPARVRRPPQARSRVPGAGPAGRRPGSARRRRRLRPPPRPATPPTRPSRAGPGVAASPRRPRAARAGARTGGPTRRPTRPRRPSPTRHGEPGGRPRTASPARPSRCPTSRPSRARRRRATCSRSPAGPAGAGGWSSR